MTVSKKLILVVDDDPDVRQLMGFILRSEYDVVFAEDGLAGMAAYEQHYEKITAVVTDLLMPKLGGDLFIKQLRERNPTLPIVLMTGATLNQDMLSWLAKTHVKFVQKPFSPTVIRQAITDSIQLGAALRVI